MGWFETIFATLQRYWAVVVGAFGGVTGLLLFLSMLKTKREEIKAKLQATNFVRLIEDVKKYIDEKMVTIIGDLKDLYRICQEQGIDSKAFIETMVSAQHNVESGIRDMFEERQTEMMRLNMREKAVPAEVQTQAEPEKIKVGYDKIVLE